MAAAVVVVGVSACQVYDFMPVQPLAVKVEVYSERVTATALRPNLLLLVDRSRSMDTPVDGGVSRMDAVVSAMSGLLATDPPVARTALMLFPEPPETPSSSPSDDACRAPTAPRVDFSPRSDTEQAGVDLAKASEVAAALAAVSTAGGTPTQAALRFAGTLPGLLDDRDGRGDYVLLLTDGLPNCNAANPNTCVDAACRCTNGPSACTGATCTLGCLDQDGSVAAAAELRRAGISTFVVGFGDETGAAGARDVLNAVAEAGGAPRACPSGADGDCAAGDTCDPATLRCRTVKYYQATSGAELEAALRAIAGRIKQDPCTYPIYPGRMIDEAFIEVTVGGAWTPSGPDTWELRWPTAADGGVGGLVGQVAFVGSTCDRLRASTPVQPVEVTIRVLVPLEADAGS